MPTTHATTHAASSVDQVPELGYRNYWYPAIQAGRLGKKPQHIKLLGDDVVLFRDLTSRTAYAMADRCPIVARHCRRATYSSRER